MSPCSPRSSYINSNIIFNFQLPIKAIIIITGYPIRCTFYIEFYEVFSG